MFKRSDYKYPVKAYDEKRNDIHDLLVNLTIYVDLNDNNFKLKCYDIFDHDGLVFRSQTQLDKWLGNCDMMMYQNQLNCAVWCATAGCGVSYQDHLKNTDPFVASFFQFHVYYQTRKILHELQCPIPHEKTLNIWQNPIQMTKLAELMSEFNIPESFDFRYYGGDNNGQGSILFSGVVHGNSFVDHRQNWYFPDEKPSFSNRHHMARLEGLQQDNVGWKYFIPEHGKGWTRAGVIRLNDSNRTYVYCILGAQAQTRAPIVNASGKSLDAQAQVLTLITDAIVESTNPSRTNSIKRYQDSIDETHSKLDFVLGSGLYLIPSDMVLKIGNIVRWNNNIQIADSNMAVGKNDRLNREKRDLVAVGTKQPKIVTEKPRIVAEKPRIVTEQPKQVFELPKQVIEQPKQKVEDHTSQLDLFSLFISLIGVVVVYLK